MTLLAIAGDTCPACGGGDVRAVSAAEAHNGVVMIDGCVSCGKAWERETRLVPALEPCTNCAFMAGSPEQVDGRFWQIIRNTVEGDGLFYCHKRLPFDAREACATGNALFESHVTDDGKRITNAPICAGWIRAKLREKRSHDVEMHSE